MVAMHTRLKNLEALASDSSNALELGKAAEHIVCADLIVAGFGAFLSDQGLPYDIILDDGGDLLRVQVKATCKAKNINCSGRNPSIKYSWSVRRRGKNGTSRLNKNDCDLVALVALDTMQVAYLPIHTIPQTVQLIPDHIPMKTRGKHSWGEHISSYPIEGAIDAFRAAA